MEVILIKDVINVGKEGELIKVKEGYARNFLLPQSLAVIATPKAVKANQKRMERRKQEEQKIKQEMVAKAEKLSAAEVNIKVEVGEEGKLFGAVTAADIAQAIKDGTQMEIDRRQIDLERPIKLAGEYKVKIRLYPEVHPEIKVVVSPK